MIDPPSYTVTADASRPPDTDKHGAHVAGAPEDPIFPTKDITFLKLAHTSHPPTGDTGDSIASRLWTFSGAATTPAPQFINATTRGSSQPEVLFVKDGALSITLAVSDTYAAPNSVSDPNDTHNVNVILAPVTVIAFDETDAGAGTDWTQGASETIITTGLSSNLVFDSTGTIDPDTSGSLGYSWVLERLNPSAAEITSGTSTTLTAFASPPTIAGDYKVTLWVSDYHAETRAEKTFRINELPNATFTPLTETVLIGSTDTVTLSAAISSDDVGISSFTWALADPGGADHSSGTNGLTSTNTTVTTWIPDEAGEWEVTLTATDTDGADHTLVHNVTVVASDEGQEKWTWAKNGEELISCPAIEGGFVFAATPKSPTIGPDGTIYLGGGAENLGKMMAINPDGSLRWAVGPTCASVLNPNNGSPTTVTFNTFPSAPVIGNTGYLYAQGQLNNSKAALIALHLGTGDPRWIYVGNTNFNLNRVDNYRTSIPHPALNNGAAYFGGVDEVWSVKVPGVGLATAPWPKFQHDEKNSGIGQ